MLISEDHLKSYPVLSEQKETSTLDLFTYNRYDLMIKYLVAIYFKRGSTLETLPIFIREMYVQHIEVVTEGGFSELSSNKVTSEDYLSSFYQLYCSILDDGFDFDKGIIPLARDGSIINGAHRVSIALALGIEKLHTVKLEINELQYTEKYFHKNGVKKTTLDFVNINFSESVEKCHIACLWPSVDHDFEHVSSLIGNRLLSFRDVNFTEQGKQNLLLHLYPNESWIGNPQDSFSGLNNKIMPCFNGNDSVRFVLFLNDKLDDVLAIKENIREIYGKGKHTVHITDTKKEVNLLSKLIFSDNSINIINLAFPCKAPNYLGEIIKLMDETFIDDLCLVGSSPIGIIGYREPTDIDYLERNQTNLNLSSSSMLSSHYSQLRYYPQNFLDDAFNGIKVFYFLGVRFAGVDVIIEMKKNRGEPKDFVDIEILHQFEKKESGVIYFAKARIQKAKVKLRWKILSILKLMGIDDALYKLYCSIRSKLK